MFKKIIIIVLILNLTLLIWLAFQPNSQNLKIRFFDVGQGDAIYIRTPYNQDILIDGGPSTAILSKLGEVMPFWDREIDIVILTHPHSDHITGLVSVLQNYQVKQVYLTGAQHTTYEYLEFLKFLRDHQNIKKIKIDHVFKVKLSEDLYLQFFYPDFDVGDASAVVNYPFIQGNLNNTSAVVQLVYKNNSFLFTGDIEAEAENYLLTSVQADPTVLKSNVLKIAHHGGKNASSSEFLKAVAPETAVISVGAGNSFGHPNQLIIDRLKSLGVEILRTDEQGDIVLAY